MLHGDRPAPDVQQLQGELAAARSALAEVRAERDRLEQELVRWRGTVLTRWTDAVSGGSTGTTRQPGHETVRLREELEAMRATLSWRVTAPLRAVQRRRLQGWR
jgi:hypothetical protein